MALTHGGNIFAISRERGWDWREVLDFSASINPLGPAPGVSVAIREAVGRIVHYPERESEPLRRALSQTWQVGEENILLGNGATELIFFLARIGVADRVTLAQPVFSEFYRAFPQSATADLSKPETWPSDGLLILTRPANPTGEALDLTVLKQHLAGTSNPVLIDESFLEFSGLESAASLLTEYPQIIVLRSLTKFYALPGLRIGALIASEKHLARWRTHREPWQVNVLAEEAALAALKDMAHADRTLKFIQAERAWLFDQIQSIPGAIPRESNANFLYIGVPHSAQGLYEHLLSRKILIRVCTGWPGVPGEGVRIAVRNREENERLLKTWREFQCD